MLFNSFIFLIYLPIVFIGYWFIFRKLRIQNVFVVAASYVFYGWWDWRFLFLIFLTTITCFISGISIQKSESVTRRKIYCGLNITLNLLILCFFKYFNFFSDNIRILFQQFGYQLDWFTLDVLLPVGISFYTFQAISYPIDVYRKKITATTDIVAFTAFISFFPQLVAGPIERSTNLLPQFLKERRFNYSKAIDGSRQILWGFFKKIVIADNCAMLANMIFGDFESYNGVVLLIGAVMFSFQIYGDFSGYSDIAIGVSKLFGIELSRNFRFPYFSRDIAEFWRRWHISLNTWFRDYVYIPLGGSRCSKIKIIRNTLVIFLLSGLWHGANWTFVVWGLYHALLFIPLILTNKNRKYLDIAADNRMLPSFKEVLSITATFVLVMIGWIVFRSNNITEGFEYIGGCFSLEGKGLAEFLVGMKTTFVATILFIILMQAVDWTQRYKSYGLQICESLSLPIRWLMYILITMLIVVFAGEQAQFIYFQF